MKKRTIALLAVLAFNHAAMAEAQGAGTRRALAQAETTQKAVDPLPICENALQAALQGRNAADVVRQAIKDMPEATQRFVAVVCTIYLAGAVSALKHASEAPRMPTGGTSI